LSGFLFTVLMFIVAIIVLVAIHEFGHFIVARLCGVKVERFSIGFGPVLWRYKDKRGTEFALSAIPLGGYVAMLDSRYHPVEDHNKPNAFDQKNVWQRIAILFAGPLANILLAIVLFWVLILPGTLERKPIIGDVIPGSIAADAGLEAGQEIIAIDGVPTATWTALNQALIRRLGESGEIRFTARYPNSSFIYESNAMISAWLKESVAPDLIYGLGITLYLPEIPPIVGELSVDGAAAKAGLLAGDKINQVDGKIIDNWQAFVEIIRRSPNERLNITIERQNKIIHLDLMPDAAKENDKVVGRIGMGPRAFTYPEELLHRTEYSLGGAFVAGIAKTWDTSSYVLLSIQKLVLGEISTKNLSGPISIAKVAGASAESGLKSFVGFLALLSVFLAVFNLLPIPTLDGGHLFYYFIEVIRGKAVSDAVQMRGNQIGFALIFCLLCIALYNDFTQIG
jgi:regulator of sigma E protease